VISWNGRLNGIAGKPVVNDRLIHQGSPLGKAKPFQISVFDRGLTSYEPKEYLNRAAGYLPSMLKPPKHEPLVPHDCRPPTLLRSNPTQQAPSP